MKSLLGYLIGIALVWIVLIDSRCAAQEDDASVNSTSQIKANGDDNDDSQIEPKPVYEDEKIQKLYERVYKKLGKMRRADSKERSEQDCFVVGTAFVNMTSGHADVCFQAVQSQESAAKHIVDFVTAPHQNEFLRWRVFGRADSTGTADKLLTSVRTQFEEAEAYRNAIMAQYQARSIRRC